MSFIMILIIVGYALAAIFALLAWIFFMLWRGKKNKRIEETNEKIIQLNINKAKLQKEKDAINDKIKRSINIDDIFNVFDELRDSANNNN